jgi:hypothetical protein
MEMSATISYDDLPMKLVANPRFIDFFYSYVIISAKLIYSHYMENPTKIPKELGKMLKFHYEDITIIGGAVVTLLDHSLTHYKQRHQLQSIDTIFQKGTSDIDMTWSMPTDPTVPAQYPEHLTFMGTTMVNTLQKVFNSKPFIDELKQTIQHIYKKNCDFRVEVEGRDYSVKYGSFSIVITFLVDDHPIKIGDLTLHDSYNSQRYNDYHQLNPSPKTMPMIMDPIYCINPVASQFYKTEQNTITLDPITPNSVPIRIPTLDRFVRQQLFAAGNLLLDPSYQPALKAKGYNHIRRVAYLLYMLHSFQKSNANNIRNIRKIGILIDASFAKLYLFNIFIQKMNMIIGSTRNESSKKTIYKNSINAFSIIPDFYSILAVKLEREQIAQQADRLAQQAQQAQQMQMPMTQMPMTQQPYRRQAPIQSAHIPLPRAPTKKGGATTRRNKASRTIKSSRR